MAYSAVSSPAVADQVSAAWGATVAGDLNTGPNQGTPAASAAAGTPTVGATETRDATLGNYTFTAVAGRRYEARLGGLTVSSTVGTDYSQVNIRNGGAATPTAASTLIASDGKYLGAAAGIGVSFRCFATFVPGAGVVTLSAFTVRVLGTGVLTPAGPRELFVVDIGPA